jgi:hypothetical protein
LPGVAGRSGPVADPTMYKMRAAAIRARTYLHSWEVIRDKVLAGDLPAAIYCVNRVDGMPRQAIDSSMTVELGQRAVALELARLAVKASEALQLSGYTGEPVPDASLAVDSPSVVELPQDAPSVPDNDQ